MDSILISVKKMLGLAEDYNAFDLDVITHINTVFMILNQMGVGPEQPFEIHDSSETWSDFFNGRTCNAVKTYVYAKVRSMFDPPQTSFLLEAVNKTISELEWRMYVEYDLK